MSIQKLYIDRQIAHFPQVPQIAERLGLTGEIVTRIKVRAGHYCRCAAGTRPYIDAEASKKPTPQYPAV